jgi:late competence protein required for DNA uptake (superfamily II DNA/RNA helicase)
LIILRYGKIFTVNPGILAKARLKLQTEEDIALCKKAKVCFRCGNSTERTPYGYYECRNCTPGYFVSTEKSLGG